MSIERDTSSTPASRRAVPEFQREGTGVLCTYRSLTDVRHIGEADALEGEDVLPGFRCVLSELLD
jgi:hypothetical protein